MQLAEGAILFCIRL